MSNDINPWRRKFIVLAENLGHLRDVPVPPLFDGFDKSLVVSVSVNNIVVDVIHADPDDSVGRILLQCRVAGLRGPFSGDAMRKALVLNQHLAHNQAGMYGLDARTKELVYCLQTPLEHVNASELMEMINAATEMALVWRREYPESLPS